MFKWTFSNSLAKRNQTVFIAISSNRSNVNETIGLSRYASHGYTYITVYAKRVSEEQNSTKSFDKINRKAERMFCFMYKNRTQLSTKAVQKFNFFQNWFASTNYSTSLPTLPKFQPSKFQSILGQYSSPCPGRKPPCFLTRVHKSWSDAS